MNIVGRVGVALIICFIVTMSYIFSCMAWDECKEEWTIGIGIIMGSIFAWLLVEKLIEWGLLA